MITLRCSRCRDLFDTEWVGDELSIMCQPCIWAVYRPAHKDFLGRRLRRLFAKRIA